MGILTHAFHYGTACFEGIRGNWDEKRHRFCIFRLKEHYERLLNGCRLLKISLPYSLDELCQLTVEVVEADADGFGALIRHGADIYIFMVVASLHGLHSQLT